MSINIETQVALNRIGHVGKTKPVDSQDTITATIHEYHIACIIKSYATKRKAVALKDIKKADVLFDTKVTKIKDDVIKHKVAETENIIESEYFNVNALVKNGARFFDLSLLKSELLKTQTTQKVEAYLEQFYSKRNPSVTITVVEKN